MIIGIYSEKHGINYVVDPDTREMSAPCGCFACSIRTQQGHFACDSIDDELAEWEREKVIVRDYVDSAWRWFVSGR